MILTEKKLIVILLVVVGAVFAWPTFSKWWNRRPRPGYLDYKFPVASKRVEFVPVPVPARHPDNSDVIRAIEYEAERTRRAQEEATRQQTEKLKDEARWKNGIWRYP